MIVTVLKSIPNRSPTGRIRGLGTPGEHGSRTYSQYQVDDIAGDTSGVPVQVHALPFQIRSSATLMVTKRPARRHRHPTSKLGVGAENLGGFGTVNNVVVQFASARFHLPLQAVRHRCRTGSKGGVKKMPYPTSGRRPIKNGIA